MQKIDLSLAAASTAYALLLEPFRPLYERHHLIWPTVAGGVALTGLALDQALRAEFGTEQARRMMRQYWRLFTIAGLPMVAWQTLIAVQAEQERRKLYVID
jgi:hypothetical protein